MNKDRQKSDMEKDNTNPDAWVAYIVDAAQRWGLFIDTDRKSVV